MTYIIPAVMPPLMETETKVLTNKAAYSGEACVSAVTMYCLMNNNNTSVPRIDENGGDVLIEFTKKQWTHAQIKKVTYRHENGAVRFQFKFQSEISNYTEDDIDVFYHVLLTRYRTLIWETDAKDVPKRENGAFIKNTNLILDRPKNKLKQNKKCQMQDKPKLIHTAYHPLIVSTYPDFFLPKPSPLEQYI